MLRKVIALFLIFTFVSFGQVYAIVWMPTNQVTLVWDAVSTDADGGNIPAQYRVEYKCYFADKNDTAKANPVFVGQTAELQLTYTMTVKGQFVLGCQAVYVEIATGEIVEGMESAISWTDNPVACADTNGDGVGDDFGVRFLVALPSPQGYRPAL